MWMPGHCLNVTVALPVARLLDIQLLAFRPRLSRKMEGMVLQSSAPSN
jgi:hypothetical protein